LRGGQFVSYAVYSEVESLYYSSGEEI